MPETTKRPTDAEMVKLLRDGARFIQWYRSEKDKANHPAPLSGISGNIIDGFNLWAAADALEAANAASRAESIAKLCNCGRTMAGGNVHDETCPKYAEPFEAKVERALEAYRHEKGCPMPYHAEGLRGSCMACHKKAFVAALRAIGVEG